jgi:flagellar basal-body rod modification protein FlgD
MSDSISASSLTQPSLSSAATSALASSAPTTSQAASATGSTALGQLTSNYSTFLNLLMTQLKNQDPSSPMDTNQFTTELVQFSSVEQQINTNSSLTQLIQLTQSGQMLQGSSIVGHTVAAANTDMTVQSGTGSIQFTTAAAEKVNVLVYNSAGTLMNSSTVNATQGTNTWSWNAAASNGTTQPDGDYKVVVNTTDATGKTTTVPFNTIGLATGVIENGGSLELQMGSVTTAFSNVQQVMN